MSRQATTRSDDGRSTAVETIALTGARRRRKRPTRADPPIGGALDRSAIDTIDETVQGMLARGRHGSLSDRDPAFIENLCRWLGPFCDVYFRGEVRHLERFPASGDVLVVGNHSGGLLTPDRFVFGAGFYRRFGFDRPTYSLATTSCSARR